MNLTIRRACLHDADLLYRWRNHPDTYRWFHTPHPVEWDEHVQWLRLQVQLETSLLLIVHEGNIPVGQVRLDQFPIGKATVSITIDPAQRGKGYGEKALQLTKSVAFDKLGYDTLYAHIHPANTASIRAFTAAGYVDEGRGTAEEVVLVARRAASNQA